jgi:MFS family permease
MDNIREIRFAWVVNVSLITLIPIALTLLSLWHWKPGSFILALVILCSAGVLAYELVRKEKMKNKTYRLAVIVAVVTVVVLFWMNVAVGGILGDAPANMMYFGVLLIACFGAQRARLEAQGMSRALFAASFAIMLIPAIALLTGVPAFTNGVAAVVGLHTVFAAMFVGSALLFRRVALDAGSRRQG